MKIKFRKSFYKDYAKLDVNSQARVDKTILLFAQDPYNYSLRMHQLKGRLSAIHSICAGGDLRLHFVFEFIDEKTAVMIAVGTHSQLYK